MNEELFRGTRLCVVGNINRDIKTAPLVPGDYLFHDGETSVSTITETVGGGGANSAFAAAALGTNVSFLGKVGADGLGTVLERTLAQNGISCHLARSEAHPTGTSINLTLTTGQRHFISSLPNNYSLAFADLNLAVVSQSDHLLRSDVWFSEAMLYGGNQQLFRAARQAGAKTSLDLNWDPYWNDASEQEVARRKHAVRSLLPLVDIAHGNVRELNEFANSADLTTTLERLAEWGAGAVVVHMGGEGAGYYHKGRLIVEPAVPAAAQLNTTGTGDVLSICMILLSRHEAMPISERLRLANTIVSEFIEGKRRLIPPLATA